MGFDVWGYATYLFDCDGVILDSNTLKSDAFLELALPHGEDLARQLVSYHRQYGGVSRFAKIRYLHEQLLSRVPSEDEIRQGAEAFGRLVFDRLLTCPLTPGFEDFMARLPRESLRMVVSGGMETELRDVFSKRGLDRHFHSIHGSPRSKEVILKEVLAGGELKFPVLFMGDSRYDYEVAAANGCDFLFLSGLSEMENGEDFFRSRGVPVYRHFSELIADQGRPLALGNGREGSV